MKNLIFFATGNKHKFREAKAILASFNISLAHLDAKIVEIQANDISEIAMNRAILVRRMYKIPVIVEDAGLFVRALGGFPGPYSSYVYNTIGNRGILKLMQGITDRKATFRSIVAYSEAGLMKPRIFKGETQGKVSHEERGSLWGFDPIFIPDEAGGRTYAEMGSEEKNNISHRRKSLEGFAKWFLKRRR